MFVDQGIMRSIFFFFQFLSIFFMSCQWFLKCIHTENTYAYIVVAAMVIITCFPQKRADKKIWEKDHRWLRKRQERVVRLLLVLFNDVCLLKDRINRVWLLFFLMVNPIATPANKHNLLSSRKHFVWGGGKQAISILHTETLCSARSQLKSKNITMENLSNANYHTE